MGRHREYDVDKVLDATLCVFWRKGYEGTSYADLTEAAGVDRDGCRLRVVSFASAAPMQKMLDWYFTKATAAGYSAGHSTDGKQHVLGGVRGNDAYVVYVTARAGGGSDVDLVSNAGR